MRRLTILLLILLLAACQASDVAPVVTAPPVITAQPTTTSLPPLPSATPTVPLAPAPATLPAPSTPAIAPAATPSPAQPGAEAGETLSVRFHPDGPLYVGDLVSFEVLAPAQADMDGKTVRVQMDQRQLDQDGGSHTTEASFGQYGIGGRSQATLFWAWDTAGLPAGEHFLTFSILPDGPVWTETVRLLPYGQAPFSGSWASVETDCCVVHYISNTAAERDLPQLLEMIDEQAHRASQRMGVGLDDPVDITLLPRVLGHGGFAREGIDVSYLDRNYAGGDAASIIHHELIHILDSRLGGFLRPSALVEGLAVYQTGGHFKLEPLLPRAAALLPPAPGCQVWPAQTGPGAVSAGETAVEGCGLDRYIPLQQLFDNFYFEQHEIGYLEASALVAYMVETWGYAEFSAFYRDIKHLDPAPADAPPGYGANALAVDAALKQHFGLDLAQFEALFLKALLEETSLPEHAEDVRLTVEYYDTVRRYQQLLDPSAHFLTAWLPENKQMRERGIVADYLRQPGEPENLALEAMLATADEALLAGDYATVAQILAAVNVALDRYPAAGLAALESQPLAADYLALVQAALAMGYSPQKIVLSGNNARVWAASLGAQLMELMLQRGPVGWQLAAGTN